jgi:hypothetical protein
MDFVEQIEGSNNDAHRVHLANMATQTYEFINATKYGAYYLDYYEKVVNGVTYTFEEAEGLKWIQFTANLTSADKDQLLSRDGLFQLEIDYEPIDSDSSCTEYDVYLAGEGDMDDVQRSTIPEELQNELEQIQDGETTIEECGWVQVDGKLMLEGGIVLFEDSA